MQKEICQSKLNVIIGYIVHGCFLKDGGKVFVVKANNKVARFHSIWLRDNSHDEVSLSPPSVRHPNPPTGCHGLQIVLVSALGTRLIRFPTSNTFADGFDSVEGFEIRV